MKALSFLCMSLIALCVSCERHEFDGPEGTRQLHEHGHADHADHHHDQPATEETKDLN